MKIKGRKSEAGFTLTEIMVVVVIIGLLTAVIAGNVFSASTTARVTKAKADIAALEQNLALFQSQIGVLPTEAQGLEALVEAPSDLVNPTLYPSGGFIRRLQQDPWGRPYQYINPAERSRAGFDVFSYGADGEPGGEEENADIGNWE